MIEAKYGSIEVLRIHVTLIPAKSAGWPNSRWEECDNAFQEVKSVGFVGFR